MEKATQLNGNTTMQIKTVNLQLSQLFEDLASGMTWFKRDDLGYGSIQEKYKANDMQINIIKKDPRLKDAVTCTTIFKIIDDTNGTEFSDSKSNTNPSSSTVKNAELSEPKSTNVNSKSIRSAEPQHTDVNDDDLTAFANL